MLRPLIGANRYGREGGRSTALDGTARSQGHQAKANQHIRVVLDDSAMSGPLGFWSGPRFVMVSSVAPLRMFGAVLNVLACL